MSQFQGEEQRAEAFRAFVAQQLQTQTKSLDTIRTLMALWTVLVAIGIVFAVVGALAS